MARTQSQATSAPQASATVTPAPADNSDAASTDDLFLLFGLAPLVGERGAVIVERVLRQVIKGNTRAYRAEINRLAGKFIAAIEPVPPLDPR